MLHMAIAHPAITPTTWAPVCGGQASVLEKIGSNAASQLILAISRPNAASQILCPVSRHIPIVVAAYSAFSAADRPQ